MADNFTGFLNLIKPEVGGSRDSWGQKLGANFDSIDTWAKATDPLAKDALPRTATAKDGNGAVIPWTVAGPVAFTSPITVSSIKSNGAVTITGDIAARDGNFSRDAASGVLYFGTSQTRSLALSGTDAGFTGITSLSLSGQSVYHTGNLNPALFVKDTGDVMTGALEISVDNPYLYLNYPTKKRGRLTVDANANFIWQDQNGTSHFVISNSGAVSTQQFGDLNTRIEARAQSFADDRLATARAYTQSYSFPLVGGVTSGNIEIQKSFPLLVLHYPSVLRAGIQTTNASRVQIINVNSGAELMSVGVGGDISCAEFGGLNGRIETRAQQFADDRLTTATARINNKNVRLAYLADVNVGGNPAGRGMFENYGAGIITGFAQNNGIGYITDVRYRQLQMSDSNGSWYASYYS